MVLIDSYTGLYEVDLVSPIWKGCQICIYVVAACNSIAAAYTFSLVYMHFFDQNCLLYSDVRFIKEMDQGEKVILDMEDRNKSTRELKNIGNIDNFKTEWGKESICLFCQYVPICSFISSFVWATFFTMCGKGGKTARGLPSPWRIVAPAFIFSVIYFILSLVSASFLQGGYKTFCINFKANMNETLCEKISNLTNTNTESNVYNYIVISEFFAWADVGMWLLGIGLLIMRCIFVPDFDLHRIQLYTPHSVQHRPAPPAAVVDDSQHSKAKRKRLNKLTASANVRQLMNVADEVLRRKRAKRHLPPFDMAGPSTAPDNS